MRLKRLKNTRADFPVLIESIAALQIHERHRDPMWLLGGEIIRRRHDNRAKMPMEDLLFDLLEDEGGRLIWPRITESEQNAFDATCRKLYRFLNQAKPRS